MRKLSLFSFVLVGALASADTLVLNNGTVVKGKFAGGTLSSVKMEVDGKRIQTFAVRNIARLEFGDGAATVSQGELAPKKVSSVSGSSANLMAGTPINIIMIDSIDSEKDTAGQEFRASIDEPILVDGKTVVPKGADATVKLVEDKSSGKLRGRAELTLALSSLTVNGRKYELSTSEVTQASRSRTNETAKKAGVGAAIGAVIGAVAGGGKGAAIGAATGAGAGTAIQIFTKGEKVQIPSETRLTFTLSELLAL